MQYAVTVSGGYATPSRWSVRGSLGAVLGGRLEGDGLTHDIGPGFVVAASIAKQIERGAWFVTGSLGAAASRTTTDEEVAGGGRRVLSALDLVRVGAMAGRRLGLASPYVSARGFLGPVSWTLDGMDVTGGDTSKFQFGAGTSVSWPSGMSLLLDVSVLGERSLSIGASYRL